MDMNKIKSFNRLGGILDGQKSQSDFICTAEYLEKHWKKTFGTSEV